MDSQQHTLRESLRKLMPQADLLARRFYDTLFARAPQMIPLFDGVCFEDQRGKLMRALALVVRHVERPEFLFPYLRGLGAIHKAYGVAPEHYPAFADCLVGALAATAGPSWGPEEDAAWRGACLRICDAMIAGATRLG